ncbi:MAG: hypothetical protein HRU35_08310 [Rickettsiaceae bacterium]|nr:hypothetical protein [Rickettsiaceae bacterium]
MSKKTKRVSLDFPIDIVEKIDDFCKENFITRRKWFIDAAKDKIEKDNQEKVDMLVRK